MSEVARILLHNAAGDILMVQEAKPEAYKLWTLPGGTVLPGETSQAGAIRETREETDYQVELLSEIPLVEAELAGDLYWCSYAGKVASGRLRAGQPELLAARWLSSSQLVRLGGRGRLRDCELILESVLRARHYAHSRH